MFSTHTFKVLETVFQSDTYFPGLNVFHDVVPDAVSVELWLTIT